MSNISNTQKLAAIDLISVVPKSVPGLWSMLLNFWGNERVDSLTVQVGCVLIFIFAPHCSVLAKKQSTTDSLKLQPPAPRCISAGASQSRPGRGE